MLSTEMPSELSACEYIGLFDFFLNLFVYFAQIFHYFTDNNNKWMKGISRS